jgi:hypothetical protein
MLRWYWRLRRSTRWLLALACLLNAAAAVVLAIRALLAVVS